MKKHFTPKDFEGSYEVKIDIKKSLPIERHCASCASWGDCPCGDKNCRWKSNSKEKR